jgi:hypothetical protein
VARAPNEPKTIVYQWNLAMQRRQFDEARQILDHGKTTPLKPEAIDMMEKETTDTITRSRHKLALGILLLLVVAAGGYLGATIWRRRRSELRAA